MKTSFACKLTDEQVFASSSGAEKILSEGTLVHVLDGWGNGEAPDDITLHVMHNDDGETYTTEIAWNKLVPQLLN